MMSQEINRLLVSTLFAAAFLASLKAGGTSTPCVLDSTTVRCNRQALLPPHLKSELGDTTEGGQNSSVSQKGTHDNKNKTKRQAKK